MDAARTWPGWPRSGTGWCTAARAFTAPTLIDDEVRRRDRGAGAARPAAQPGQPHRHRGGPRAAARTCRRSPSSTPRSTRRSRRARGHLRDRRRDWRDALRGSAGTASTAPRTRTSPGAPPSCWAGRSAEVNVIVLHLGNGASACAVAGGRSVDTSMGLTPLEGLVMGTRSGDIDPAVVFHLRRVGRAAASTRSTTLLNQRSGLLGPVRRQRHAGGAAPRGAAGDAAAALAFDVYCHRLTRVRRRLPAPCSAGSTRSPSPPGSGENSAAVRARRAGRPGARWASRSTPARNAARGREPGSSRRTARRSRSAWCRPTRSWRSPEQTGSGRGGLTGPRISGARRLRDGRGAASHETDQLGPNQPTRRSAARRARPRRRSAPVREGPPRRCGPVLG